MGGWLNLMEMRRAKVFVRGDERILGEGDFVEQMLQESGEAFERKSLLKSQGTSPIPIINNGLWDLAEE